MERVVNRKKKGESHERGGKSRKGKKRLGRKGAKPTFERNPHVNKETGET